MLGLASLAWAGLAWGSVLGLASLAWASLAWGGGLDPESLPLLRGGTRTRLLPRPLETLRSLIHSLA